MLGKVALITGAAQGIGRAIAQRLARDGYNVALNDLHLHKSALLAFRDELIESHPERHYTIAPADTSKDGEVQGMMAKVVKQLGGLDVLVANARHGGSLRTLVDSKVSQEDETWATNIRGTWLCFHYAAKQMIAQGQGGRIIGASSEAGKAGFAGAAAYSASKFAIRGMTQSVELTSKRASELGPYNITVNSYAPGPVATELPEALLKGTGIDFDEFYRNYADTTATKRNSEPEDVAALVSFLVSEKARNITGQTINVDGGRRFD